jgi:hypothetical protein
VSSIFIGHAPPAIQFVGEELITSHVGRHADGAEHADEADGYMIDDELVQSQARGHTTIHP